MVRRVDSNVVVQLDVANALSGATTREPVQKLKGKNGKKDNGD